MTGPEPIRCVGLSAATAPVHVRERVSVGREQLSDFLARARASAGPVVVLSTCYRVEVYASGATFGALAALLGEEAAPYTYHLEGHAAVRHLYRVATGLESVVIGEPQVLGQVASALPAARAAGPVPPPLRAAFEGAIRVGKRARQHTGIGRGAASTASVGVRVAAKAVGGLAGRDVVVLGAGQIARLAVKALRGTGIGALTVLNRDPDGAAALAASAGGSGRPLEALPALLPHTDIVLCAVASASPLVRVSDLEAAAAQRGGRPLVVVDLGMPRNVEPGARTAEGVTLFDVDDLRSEADAALKARLREVPAVEALVEEEVEAFAAWERRAVAEPLIREVRLKAERIRQAELERLRKVDSHAAARAEAFSRALVNKLLHDLTVALRASADAGQMEHSALVRDLFRLNGTEG
ncbi:MAG TPA: glutamyl-tRNA reductase [Rubricoccaceae bacterium]|nr:glutamyl-tRNA reductase [Rubricoccaceae bacterium]